MLDRETERTVMKPDTTQRDSIEAAAAAAAVVSRNLTAEQYLRAARLVRVTLLTDGAPREYADERARIYEILAEKARREADEQVARGTTSARSGPAPRTAGEVYAEEIAMGDILELEGFKLVTDQLKREGIKPQP
jgi:hypothetical protein